LEYPVKPDVIHLLEDLGLVIISVIRVAQNGTRITHLILGMEQDLLDQYEAEFDGAVIQPALPWIARSEARYFGFPDCCAEAYIKAPHAPNHLTTEEQSLLFHRACLGCKETPRLIPFYRLALAEARRLHRNLRS